MSRRGDAAVAVASATTVASTRRRSNVSRRDRASLADAAGQVCHSIMHGQEITHTQKSHTEGLRFFPKGKKPWHVGQDYKGSFVCLFHFFLFELMHGQLARRAGRPPAPAPGTAPPLRPFGWGPELVGVGYGARAALRRGTTGAPSRDEREPTQK